MAIACDGRVIVKITSGENLLLMFFKILNQGKTFLPRDFNIDNKKIGCVFFNLFQGALPRGSHKGVIVIVAQYSLKNLQMEGVVFNK